MRKHLVVATLRQVLAINPRTQEHLTLKPENEERVLDCYASNGGIFYAVPTQTSVKIYDALADHSINSVPLPRDHPDILEALARNLSFRFVAEGSSLGYDLHAKAEVGPTVEEFNKKDTLFAKLNGNTGHPPLFVLQEGGTLVKAFEVDSDSLEREFRVKRDKETYKKHKHFLNN